MAARQWPHCCGLLVPSLQQHADGLLGMPSSDAKAQQWHPHRSATSAGAMGGGVWHSCSMPFATSWVCGTVAGPGGAAFGTDPVTGALRLMAWSDLAAVAPC